jgi:DNA invertase Pin-like site-specific DNA recombinase
VKTALGYIRVSTEKQELSLDAQRSAIERWSEYNGLTIRAWFVDEDVHGDDPHDKRPGLSAALADAKYGEDIVILRRDRLARDVMVAGIIGRVIANQGGRIRSTDGSGELDGPEGVLVRGIMDLFAQYERLMIVARTKAALAKKRERGEATGHIAPMGYSIKKRRHAYEKSTLQVNEDEVKALARMRELRAGGVSYRAIAKTLTAEGFKPRGEAWHPSTILRMTKGAA